MVVRTALSKLGARVAVVPELTGSLARSRALVGGTAQSPFWPNARLADVLNDLADHQQIVLYLRLWPLTADGEVVWVNGRGPFESAFDWAVPWQDNLVRIHEAALRYAADTPPGRERAVEIEWIDESDITL